MSTTTTTSKTFTLEEALAAMRDAVEEKGDEYRYPVNYAGCVYAVDGMPSCIVGHVIHRLDPAEFDHLAASERESKTSELIEMAAGRGWIRPNLFTDDAFMALRAAQRRQDRGDTWSEALYAAENLGADAE